jgi:predicted dehydrogenase
VTEETVQTTRIGVIGCGRIAGLRHLPALARLPEAQVVAVADEDSSRLRAAAERFGVGRRYDSHAELLADSNVDAVAVLVPATRHAEVALDALAAGKHVLLEKPVSLDIGDADRLVDACAASDRHLLVAYNLRWHRLVREARRMIAAGAIGQPEVLSTSFTMRFLYRGEASPWRLVRETGGGVLVEMASHHFDLSRYLLQDELREVSVLAQAGELEDDAAVVQASTAGGTLVTGRFSQRTIDSHEVDLLGREGRLRFDIYAFDGVEVMPFDARAGDVRRRLASTARFLRHLPGGVVAARAGGLYVQSYWEEWRHFLAVCRGETTPECTIEDGRESLRDMLAAAESASTKRVVTREDAPTTLVSAGAA